MPNKIRQKWQRPFNWPPSTWEFTPGMQLASDIALAFVFLLIVITVLAAIAMWPMLVFRTLANVNSGSADDVRNNLLAIAALIGVPFLVWRTLIASKQANIGRESHYTALFTKAVEQLGADKVSKKRDFKPEYKKDTSGQRILDNDKRPVVLKDADGEAVGEYQSYETTVKNYEVRLGAIYALERIAQDSERDAWPIYQTLCAYIQNNAPARKELHKEVTEDTNYSDIEEIFNVLNRYRGPRDHEALSYFDNLHLNEIELRAKKIEGMAFFKCSIRRFSAGCDIGDVTFNDCQIGTLAVYEGAFRDSALVDSQVEHLYFRDAEVSMFELQGGSIDKLNITGATVKDCIFNLGMVRLGIAGSYLEDAHFSGLDQGMFYSRKPEPLFSNVFSRCEFSSCDFAGVDLSANDFKNCKFVRCNLVGTIGINGEGNTFQDCLTDTNFSPTEGGNLAQQLSEAWIKVRYGRPL